MPVRSDDADLALNVISDVLDRFNEWDAEVGSLVAGFAFVEMLALTV